MSLHKFVFIHSDELPFLHDKLSSDDGVISIDGLTKDNRRDGIMHPGKTKFIQFNGKEVGALSNFQAANIFSTKYCCSTACAQIECFTSRHQRPHPALSLRERGMLSSPSGRGAGGEGEPSNTFFHTRQQHRIADFG